MTPPPAIPDRAAAQDHAAPDAVARRPGPTTARQWRGSDKGTRVAERRQRLLAGGLELIARHGISGVTVRGVCSTSGLTTRYFYESFTDLPDLLLSLYDEAAADAVSAIGRGMAAATSEVGDPLSSVVASGLAYLSNKPRECHFLLVDAAGDPAMNRRRRTLIGQVAAQATHLWSDHVPGSPTLITSGMAARFALGGLIEFATAYLEGDLNLTEAECGEAALGLLRAFITSEGALQGAPTAPPTISQPR